MEIIVLLLYEVLLLFLEVKLIRKSFFSISFISTSTILMSTIAALYSKINWNLSLTGYTISVIIVGLSIMFIGELFAQKIVFFKKNRVNIAENSGYISINKSLLIGINLFVLICFMLYFFEVMRVGKALGGTGLNCIAIVKHNYINNPSGNYMNILIRQSFKFVIAISYIFTFIFINNILVKKKIKGNWYYLFPIMIGLAITIVSGSRGDILKILAAAIFDFYIISFNYGKEDKAFLKNMIYKFSKILIILIVLIFVVMFLSKKVVKTADVKTSDISNVVDYIAFYAGSSIAVLNQKIDIKYSDGGFLVGNDLTVPEFVYLGNLDYGGNVSTIFGQSLLNYGFIFMCINIFLVYFIFAMMIHSIEKEQTTQNSISAKVIVTSYLFNFVIFAFYSDLTGELFRLSNIITIIIIIFICKFVRMSRIYK